jgi:hypothetical protein
LHEKKAQAKGIIMSLIGISILIGIIGSWLGGTLGGEFYSFLLGIIGFLSPGLYVLDQIYQEVRKSK